MARHPRRGMPAAAPPPLPPPPTPVSRISPRAARNLWAPLPPSPHVARRRCRCAGAAPLCIAHAAPSPPCRCAHRPPISLRSPSSASACSAPKSRSVCTSRATTSPSGTAPRPRPRRCVRRAWTSPPAWSVPLGSNIRGGLCNNRFPEAAPVLPGAFPGSNGGTWSGYKFATSLRRNAGGFRHPTIAFPAPPRFATLLFSQAGFRGALRCRSQAELTLAISPLRVCKHARDAVFDRAPAPFP